MSGASSNHGLELPLPKVAAELDPDFRPATLAHRHFENCVRSAPVSVPIILAMEQSDGSVFRHKTAIFPETNNASAGNYVYLERLIKFLLWSRGGFRIHFAGPKDLAVRLERHFRNTDTGRFDSNLIGERVYGQPIAVVHVEASELPPERVSTRPLGRHWNGCRIGFDLGGSDRKVAAVMDGNTLFSEETDWNPYPQPDPQYHFDGIMDSLTKAAAHLPRVDAIGGSAAGIYVNNQVKVASLFRGVPPDLFENRVRNLFKEIQASWKGVPFVVVNDGEVTALSGAMALGKNAVLGLALGTSLAGGYVNRFGNITSWLNELAFAPVDYNPAAPRDEWSGDYGVGAQYFSQQAVGRLAGPAGIEVKSGAPLPELLKHVQRLLEQGDERARKIFRTIGTYLGYAVAHYASFYDFDHVLILGRVTSGGAGGAVVEQARAALREEFPRMERSIAFHLPDEKDKRHGQAIAAASLPVIGQP